MFPQPSSPLVALTAPGLQQDTRGLVAGDVRGYVHRGTRTRLSPAALLMTAGG